MTTLARIAVRDRSQTGAHEEQGPGRIGEGVGGTSTLLSGGTSDLYPDQHFYVVGVPGAQYANLVARFIPSGSYQITSGSVSGFASLAAHNVLAREFDTGIFTGSLVSSAMWPGQAEEVVQWEETPIDYTLLEARSRVAIRGEVDWASAARDAKSLGELLPGPLELDGGE